MLHGTTYAITKIALKYNVPLKGFNYIFAVSRENVINANKKPNASIS